MQNAWIVDVIADLRTYARSNDLSALAEQLDDALIVAAIETAPGTLHTRAGIRERHDSTAGKNSGTLGAGEGA